MKKKGFTLIELLVVISIIGILTLISASSYITAQKKGRDAQKKAVVNSMTKALQMYYNDFGEFPADLNWGGELSVNGYIYMKEIPVKNVWGKEIVYEVSSKRKSYNLFIDLENREDSQCNQNSDGTGAYVRFGNDYCYGVASPNTKVGELTTD